MLGSLLAWLTDFSDWKTQQVWLNSLQNVINCRVRHFSNLFINDLPLYVQTAMFPCLLITVVCLNAFQNTNLTLVQFRVN